MSADNTLILRVQEIIDKSQGTISARAAIKEAFDERYRTREELLEVLTTFASSIQNQLKRATHDLPEQECLFDIPGVIAVNTPDGVLFVHRDAADLGQVRQWSREGFQHHATQRLRFKRVMEQLELIEAEPDETKWVDARHQLETIKNVEIDS